MDRDGDDSRSKESDKLAGLSQARYLVTVHEALGLTCAQVLDSGVAAVEAMMQEYAYLCHERNKAAKGEDKEEDGDWITMPDFENGGTKRVKKGRL